MFSIHDSLAAIREFLFARKAEGEVIGEDALKEFKDKHGIRGKTDGDHLLLDYSMLDVKWNEPYGLAARGLVLDARTLKVLGCGLQKFFNIGEFYAADIDWDTVRTFEKLDGTMFLRWWSPYTKQFECTTRFQLPGDVESNTVLSGFGITWKQLFQKAVGDVSLYQKPNESMVLEVMSPHNRVVVQHDDFKFGILAVRNNETLEESLLDHPLISPHAAKVFDLSSLDTIQAFCQDLSGTEQEGFVVVDGSFNRVKIKAPGYLALHHLKDSAGSLNSIIEIVRHGEESEVCSYFPEFGDTVEKIRSVVTDLIEQHVAAYDELKDIKDQKEFALAVQALKLSAPGVLFAVRLGKLTGVREGIMQMDAPRFIRLVKPLVQNLISVEDEVTNLQGSS